MWLVARFSALFFWHFDTWYLVLGTWYLVLGTGSEVHCTWEGVPHVVGCQMWQKVSEEPLCGNYPTYVAGQQFVPYCPNYLFCPM